MFTIKGATLALLLVGVVMERFDEDNMIVSRVQ